MEAGQSGETIGPRQADIWEGLDVAKSRSLEVRVDRRRAPEARTNSERRSTKSTVATDRRQSQRRKVPRRRQIDPTTCERDYSDQEIEFMNALDEYKRKSGRMFPTCSEILEVIRALGYEKTGQAAADTPAEAELVEAGCEAAVAD